jgi:hypothetical protein
MLRKVVGVSMNSSDPELLFPNRRETLKQISYHIPSPENIIPHEKTRFVEAKVIVIKVQL